MSNFRKYKLKDLGDVVTGATPKTSIDEYWENGDILFVSPGDMKGDKFIKDTERKVSLAGAESVRIIPANSIMVTCIGSTIGKMALSSQTCVTNQQINTIIPKQDYDSNYIYYALLNNINIFERLKGTTAVPIINKSNFQSLEIMVPSLKEQQKITEILSSVDEAIEKTEQVIAKTEEVKKGLMQQLLTKGIGHTEFKQTTIGEIPVEWEAIKAKDIFSNVSIKNNHNEELLSVTQENGVVPRKDLESRVTMPEGSVKSYKLVVPGDFIISLRSFQGGLELSKIRGIVSPAYTILQSQIEIDEEYFKYFFKSMWFINRLNSAVIGIRDGKQISYSVFSDLYFPIPPLNEQKKISNILNNIDKRLYIEKNYLNQQQQIKQGLMQQLLTGQVRVKVD